MRDYHQPSELDQIDDFSLWEFLYISPESGENVSNSHWNRKWKIERLVFL